MAPAAPLHTFSQHDGELTITDVLDSECEGKRLCELGLCPGKTLRIVASGNPAIVATGETRFAVSSDLLSRVFARPS